MLVEKKLSEALKDWNNDKMSAQSQAKSTWNRVHKGKES